MSSKPTTSQLIRDRLQGTSRPGEREDQYKLALCVEGGGMRGTISMGMIVALQESGSLRAFDQVYGTSIGSLNSAYLLARQADWDNADLYMEALEDDCLFRIPARGRWPLDLNWLFGPGIHHVRPLDLMEVLEAHQEFHPLIWQVGEKGAKSGHPHLGLKPPGGLICTLQGGCCLPLIAGKPQEGRWMDAGPYEPWPMYTPILQGATHLLILRTSALGADRYADGKLGEWAAYYRETVARLNRKNGGKMYAEHELHAEALSGKDWVEQIRPLEQTIFTFSRSEAKVKNSARLGHDLFSAWAEQAGI